MPGASCTSGVTCRSGVPCLGRLAAARTGTMSHWTGQDRDDVTLTRSLEQHERGIHVFCFGTDGAKWLKGFLRRARPSTAPTKPTAQVTSVPPQRSEGTMRLGGITP
jgi:hypothetical protein